MNFKYKLKLDSTSESLFINKVDDPFNEFIYGCIENINIVIKLSKEHELLLL